MLALEVAVLDGKRDVLASALQLSRPTLFTHLKLLGVVGKLLPGDGPLSTRLVRTVGLISSIHGFQTNMEPKALHKAIVAKSDVNQTNIAPPPRKKSTVGLKSTPDVNQTKQYPKVAKIGLKSIAYVNQTPQSISGEWLPHDGGLKSIGGVNASLYASAPDPYISTAKENAQKKSASKEKGQRRADARPTAVAVEREEAEAEADVDGELYKFPVLGAVRPFQLTIACSSGDLDPEDLARLLWVKNHLKAHPHLKPWWDAAILGISKRLRSIYVAQWSIAQKAPESAFRRYEEASTRMEKDWLKAAENIVRVGVSVEHFLMVAKEGCKYAMPLVAWLAGAAMVDRISNWQSREDRKAAKVEAEEKAAFEGMDWEELVARSRDMGTLD
jgi:hypothetical protein